MQRDDTPRLRRHRDYRVPVPEGRASFELAFGGVRVSLLDLPTAWDPFVTEQYAPYARRLSGEPVDLAIRCREGSGTFIPVAGKDATIEILTERTGPERYHVRSHFQDGWLDLASGTAELVVTAREWDRFSMSVENFLRIASQLLLVSRGKFLMHTAAIVDVGRVHLFFGPSGAGKSTASAFSLPRHALSDDMVIIDTAGERAVAESVPFYMVFPPDKRLAGRWPIAGAFRLRQSPDDRLERLGAARAVATVSASIPFVHELGLPHEGLTRLVGRLCEKVPVFDLHFTRSGRFWDIIRAEGL
ncbi:MAG: hypothetical protein KBD01_20225 [Acidobacteria bacterium]|nr:hypothetical protein [Acidobacteriota bacterium]